MRARILVRARRRHHHAGPAGGAAALGVLAVIVLVSPTGAAASVSASGATPFSVEKTLVLFNRTVLPANFNSSQAAVPQSVVYDALDHRLYVAGSSLVAVDPATLQVVRAIPKVASAYQLAYDPQSREIFATLDEANAIDVLSTATDTVVKVLPGSGEPTGVSYDSANGNVYVADYDTGILNVIDGRSNRFVGELGNGTLACPYGAAFDPGNGHVYASAEGYFVEFDPTTGRQLHQFRGGDENLRLAYDSMNGLSYLASEDGFLGNVYVVNTTTGAPVARMHLGGTIYGDDAVFDRPDGKLFVTAGHAVDVFEARTGALAQQVPVPGADGVAFDPLDHRIFVTSPSLDRLTALDSRTDAVVGSSWVAAEPEGVAVVPSAGEVFVADAGANLVRVVSSSGPREVADIPVGTQPAAIVYAAARGLVYVSDSGSGQVSVLDAATHRRVATVSLGRSVVPTAMAYVPDRSELWVADAAFPSSGIFVVSTSTNRVVANVSVDAWGTPAGGMAYDPVDHRILLVETQANRLVSIRTADRGVVATASTKFQPLGALYDPVARIFLVGESNFATAFVPPFTSRVYEVAAATLRNGSSVGVGPGPSALARDPATGDILVAITAGNRVAVLTDTAGLRLVATVSTAQAPDAFAALGPAGPVWVANYASGSISILRD